METLRTFSSKAPAETSWRRETGDREGDVEDSLSAADSNGWNVGQCLELKASTPDLQGSGLIKVQNQVALHILSCCHASSLKEIAEPAAGRRQESAQSQCAASASA